MTLPGAERPIIGWTEEIDFPDWNIRSLRAKTDTGARTSALHVENLRELPDGRVEFDVILSHPEGRRKKVVSPVVRWARVRSSSGHMTERCFVRTLARIAGVEKEIEISLVSRETMRFRMLLGRTAIGHSFLIDVSRRRKRRRKPHSNDPRAAPHGD